MHTNQRKILMLGAAIAFLSVAFGAFGAHALKEMLGEAGRHPYDLGVRYAFIHALSIMLFALALPLSIHPRRLNVAVWLLALGVGLFSGSLVIYAISGVSKFAMIVPLGGLCLLGGWIVFIFSMRGSKA